MHYKQVANRRKEKWQTGGRDKCHSAAKPIEFLKVWLIRIPRFCVDDSNSVPNLPLPMKNIGKKAPGSFIHKLYGLRSPDPLHKRVGEPDYYTRHPDDVLKEIGCPETLLELFALADMYDILELKTKISKSLQEFEINHANLIHTATVASSYKGLFADISTELLMLCLKFYLGLDATDKDALLESSDGILQELMEVGRSTLQFPGNSFCRTLISQFCRLGHPSLL